jgi:hypothetical protein
VADDLDALLARLSALTATVDGADGYDPDEWIVDASTAMDAAAAAVRAQREENERWRRLAEHAANGARMHEAERDRLAAALRDGPELHALAYHRPTERHDPVRCIDDRCGENWPCEVEQWRSSARQALAGNTETEGA